MSLFKWVVTSSPDTVPTWVVAVEVVLLLDPHICWNCTLISANVSMMTAINTFWKKITNHVYQRRGMREGNLSLKQKICRSCQKTQVLLLGNRHIVTVPSQATQGRIWEWWNRSRNASGESCQLLCTWGTPSPPGRQPRRLWRYWCLARERRAGCIMVGFWYKKNHFPEVQSILIHYHCLNDLLKS